MADIHDLDLDHLKKFLVQNGIFVPKERERIYEKAFDLMNQKITLYDDADISIVQWLLAYNALKNNVVNRRYTESEINNLSKGELDKLAKKLGMKGNNIDNILTILRFMNKLYTKVEKETITGIYDIDKILLQTIDPEELNNLTVNDYTRKILNNQDFWKERLRARLGLTTNRNIDYRYIIKFLDNGKSFEENYQYALKNAAYDIIDILLENDVVMVNKHNYLLNDIHLEIEDLGEFKKYSYNKFINLILDKTNEIIEDEESDFLDPSYFDKKVYTGDAIIIELPNVFFDYREGDRFDEDRPEEMITYIFRNKNGFTNGEILYELAQKIPNDEEIKQHNIEIIKKHPDQFLDDIKDAFKRLDIEIKEGDNSAKKRLDYLRKHYNIITISQLLKDPIKFMKHYENYPSLSLPFYNFYDVWRNRNLWGGLKYYNGKYHVELGSY